MRACSEQLEALNLMQAQNRVLDLPATHIDARHPKYIALRPMPGRSRSAALGRHVTAMSSLAQRSTVRDRAHGRGTVMAALDIGSSKVTCMIARRADATNGEPRVAGAGAQATKGVRAGAVVDLDGLERSIRLAVEQAERAADLRITDVVLGVSGPGPALGHRARQAAHGRARSDGRSTCATSGSPRWKSFQPQGREVLHSAPLGFIGGWTRPGSRIRAACSPRR